jgi:hypothetical protein
MDKKDNQKYRFYLGAALLMFPAGFFAYSVLGMLAATTAFLMVGGAILLFTTVLDMKLAEIEIRIVEEKDVK